MDKSRLKSQRMNLFPVMCSHPQLLAAFSWSSKSTDPVLKSNCKLFEGGSPVTRLAKYESPQLRRQVASVLEGTPSPR